MPIKHIWSILCQRSIIDSQTNNISLLDSLEQVEIVIDQAASKVDPKVDIVSAPKALPYQYSLVSFWTRGDEDTKEIINGSIKIQIVDPSGKKIQENNSEVKIPQGLQRIRNVAKYTHIFVTSSGTYRFRVSMKSKGDIDYEPVAEIPLEVRLNIK